MREIDNLCAGNSRKEIFGAAGKTNDFVGTNKTLDSVGKAKSGPGDSDMESDWVEFKQAVCTGTLKFSPAAESRLLLAYRGELEFEDSGTSKSALPDFTGRTLRYALFPAGFWAGPAEKVEIVIELGRFASRAELKHPSGAKLVGSEARWLLENVDLKKIPWLEISVEAGDLLRGDFLIHFNRDCQKDWFCFKTEVRASSELTTS